MTAYEMRISDWSADVCCSDLGSLMMNDIQHVAADPLDGISQALDRAAAVGIAHLTHGLSPVTMILAATDWALHLACAPGKQLQLGAKAARKYWRLSDYIGRRDRKSTRLNSSH